MYHLRIGRGTFVPAIISVCLWSGATAAATGLLPDEIECDPPVGWPDHACPVGTPEGEWEQDPTCGLIVGGDPLNSGCGCVTPGGCFSPISCGQTICGTWSTLVEGTTILRDTDWYELELTQRTRLIVTMTGEFDISLGLISSCGTGDCGMMPEWPYFWAAGGYYSAACNDPAVSPGGYEADHYSFDLCVEPGVWWIFVSGDWGQAPVDCADYVLTLQCQAPCHVPCCVGNDVCVEVSETECVYSDEHCPSGLGGSLPDGADCAPGLCAWGCVDAVALDCNSSQEVDNSVNSDTPRPPMSCATGDSIGVLWFKFVATHTSVQISTCDSTEGDDSVFALYEGDCENTLTELDCSEDGDCGSTSWLGELCEWPLAVGETYYVQLASWEESAQGVYLLEVACPCPEHGPAACCMPGGSCTVLDRFACEAAGGWYLGPDTDCTEPDLCDPGACCAAGTSCLPDLVEELCSRISGVWLAGEDCDPNPCDGACCTYAFGSYVCTSTAEAACTSSNQVFDPDGDCDDPGFECLKAACQPQSARSCRSHGPAGVLCLDVGVGCGVEPRLGGITELEMDRAGRVYDTNPVTVDCSAPWSGTATASDPSAGDDNTVTVTFDPALPDGACCVVTLACGAEVCVCGLEGDMDRNGTVTTGDASIIKPHFGDTPTDADAEFDYDVSGLISTSDFSQVKPKFGNTLVNSCP